MKRFLLMSTATLAVGAALAVGLAPAIAQEVAVSAPFQMKITGQVNSMAGFIGKEKKEGKVGKVSLVQHNRLRFLASAKDSNGLTYGSKLFLQTQSDTGNSSMPSGASQPLVDRVFLYVSSPAWGEVDVGSLSPQRWNYAPSKFTEGLNGNVGGLNGGVYSANFIGDQSNASGNPQKLAKAIDSMAYLGADTKNSSRATKIVYTTPTLSGFTAAISFAPDGTNRAGANAIRDQAFTPSSTELLGLNNSYNWIEAAANYTGGDANFGYSAGVAYSHAQSKSSSIDGKRYQNPSSLYGGAKISSGGFTIGGGVTFDGKSRQYVDTKTPANNVNDKDAIGYALGAEYLTGPWLFGMWGQYAEAVRDTTIKGKKNKLTDGGINVSYVVAPGLKVYSELFGYKYHDQNEKAAYHNITSGVLMIGTALQF